MNFHFKQNSKFLPWPRNRGLLDIFLTSFLTILFLIHFTPATVTFSQSENTTSVLLLWGICMCCFLILVNYPSIFSGVYFYIWISVQMSPLKEAFPTTLSNIALLTTLSIPIFIFSKYLSLLSIIFYSFYLFIVCFPQWNISFMTIITWTNYKRHQWLTLNKHYTMIFLYFISSLFILFSLIYF